jgi:hypothetical protein
MGNEIRGIHVLAGCIDFMAIDRWLQDAPESVRPWDSLQVGESRRRSLDSREKWAQWHLGRKLICGIWQVVLDTIGELTKQIGDWQAFGLKQIH